ncbi:helix-turn-helix transcriptional regulator [Alloprevotella sp. oral taxon 473]|uniref:helix-turn-helix transcriptional regulator n=1 Tax=Alloprevotella sp. oral taxon 473 TaxID=712469 RepID=UPI0002A4703D|nr:helix-turn-helix transcriptional regulator [Alloprevotella sp. oral taxon 473]EKX89869.1 transcriptional regulator, y4mF family [Alloprevotella sp. oral taxon 473 str. F0040]
MVAKTTTGQFVKEVRKKYKLIQVDLSEKAGVGLRFVRESEHGKPPLLLDKVNNVFEFFGSECGPVRVKRDRNQV